MKNKVIGILGGMGPLATADLFQKIVMNTKAASDQEHIHIIIDNNTSIPDRTAALLHGGENPLPQMLKSAKFLEKAGADCIIMPCNTAHNYHARIQEEVEIPVLHMIELTCLSLRAAGISRAGLLATSGTIETEIYQQIAASCGVQILIPDKEEQQAIMDLIYCGVKAGAAVYDTTAVNTAVRHLLARGAETIILGCTELPLAVQLYHLDFPMTDPTLELAKGAILFAGKELVLS